jgi:hypothetical protein
MTASFQVLYKSPLINLPTIGLTAMLNYAYNKKPEQFNIRFLSGVWYESYLAVPGTLITIELGMRSLV